MKKDYFIGVAIFAAVVLILFGKWKTCLMPNGSTHRRPWFYPCQQGATAVSDSEFHETNAKAAISTTVFGPQVASDVVAYESADVPFYL